MSKAIKAALSIDSVMYVHATGVSQSGTAEGMGMSMWLLIPSCLGVVGRPVRPLPEPQPYWTKRAILANRSKAVDRPLDNGSSAAAHA